MTEQNSLLNSVMHSQFVASDPSTSAWVSASAGAGKTTVLVRRVLRLLLCDDVYPENILAITYTKAAASEMSNRINDSLTKWAVCEDSDLKDILYKVLGAEPTADNLRKARQLFASVLDAKGGLKIQTIHSFCQSLLGRFPFEAKIPKGFQILENTSVIMKQATTILVDDDSLLASLEIRALISGGKDFDKDLMSIVGAREKFNALFKHHGGVENSILALCKGLNVSPSAISADVVQEYKNTLASAECKSALDKHIWNLKGDEGKSTTARRQALLQWQKTNDIELFNRAMFGEGATLSKTCKLFKADNEMLLVPIQNAYDVYSANSNTVNLAQQTSAMYRIADKFITIYERIKKQKNVLDFSDIIIATDRLLKDETIAPWVLHKTDRGHAHVLLDESQDTSPEQWNIMKNLLEPFFDGSSDAHHTIFAVGDEKQSIYSFQGADPKGFIDSKNEFHIKAQEAGMVFEDVPVNVSFRSTSAVLDMVDASLSDSFAGNPVHKAMRLGQAGRVEVLPMLVNTGTHLKNMNLKAQVVLADEIAEHIHRLIGTQLPSKNHTITAGDIMVLVRSRSVFVVSLIRALKLRNIEVAGADRMNLMEQIAVEDLVALLQFMIMPVDDLNLACLLKTPLIGMTDEMLFSFAGARGKKSLWQSLRGHNEATGQFSTVVNYLNDALRKADYARPFETLNSILNSICPLGSVLGITPMSGWRAFRSRLGVEADEPIGELLNLSMTFEQNNPATLQSFIAYLNMTESEIKRDSDKGEKEEVRIMTVHGSKGLESPVVIMPDCFKKPQNPKGFMWSDTGEYCLWFSSNPKHYKNEILSPSVIASKLKKRNFEEFLRLLYVGMTRAEDILICGGMGSRDEGKDFEEDTWYDFLKKGMEKLDVQPTNYIPLTRNYGDIWMDVVQEKKSFGRAHYVYETEQSVEKKTVTQKHNIKSKIYETPDWAFTNATAESATTRPLAPSRIMEHEGLPSPSPLAKDDKGIDVFKRGNVMHRALEILPKLTAEKREDALHNYLSSSALDLSDAIQEQWSCEILTVLKEYDYLFDNASKAEVPVSGIVNVDGKDSPISGIIDRLVVRDDTVWIIDFKSNRPAPDDVANVPEVYIKQLSIYKSLMEKIYPDKAVKTALLWTYSCKIMVI